MLDLDALEKKKIKKGDYELRVNLTYDINKIVVCPILGPTRFYFVHLILDLPAAKISKIVWQYLAHGVLQFILRLYGCCLGQNIAYAVQLP